MTEPQGSEDNVTVPLEPESETPLEPETDAAAAVAVEEPEEALSPDVYVFREPAAIGVSFRRSGKVYYFAPSGLKVRQGDQVLAQTEKGVDIGEVVFVKYDLPDNEEHRKLKPLVRKASPEDMAREEELQVKEREARRVCEQKITEHKLPMRLIAADYTFDSSRLVFFFSSEGRVDFRALVKDLAEIFRTRIELRQIGVRDQAKMIGGLGPCGRPLCCNAWLRNFDPVGIRVAKDQGLSLNPAKISGICDRLMCCLRYEHETYLELSRKLPKPGQIVSTRQGPAVVKSVLLMHERIKVEYPDGKTEDLTSDNVWPENVEPPVLAEAAPAEIEEEYGALALETDTPTRLIMDGPGDREGRSRKRRRRKPGKGGAPAGEAPAATPAQPAERPPNRPAPKQGPRKPGPKPPAEASSPAPAAPPADEAKPEGAARKRRRPRYRSRSKGDKPEQGQ